MYFKHPGRCRYVPQAIFVRRSWLRWPCGGTPELRNGLSRVRSEPGLKRYALTLRSSRHITNPRTILGVRRSSDHTMIYANSHFFFFFFIFFFFFFFFFLFFLFFFFFFFFFCFFFFFFFPLPLLGPLTTWFIGTTESRDDHRDFSVIKNGYLARCRATRSSLLAPWPSGSPSSATIARPVQSSWLNAPILTH